MAKDSSDPKKPAHGYDKAMRAWGESNPVGLAAWLDPSLADLSQEALLKKSTALHDPLLNAPVLHLDLLLTIGAHRVMHVEYETSPRPGLAERMYDYRARLRREYPGRRLTQHVIVLGEGHVTGHDDYEANDFVLNLRPVYLREHDPTKYLSDPFLAPLATLARGSPEEREQSFAAALRLLARSEHPLARLWVLTAISLAALRLDRSTIDRLRRKEHVSAVDAISEFFMTDPSVQQLMMLSHERGQAAGRREGREEGREEGRAERDRIILALIRMRFGDVPEAETAGRMLGSWDDAEAALAAIDAAASLEELARSASPEHLPPR